MSVVFTNSGRTVLNNPAIHKQVVFDEQRAGAHSTSVSSWELLPFDPAILTGQLRPSSIAQYRRDMAAYLAYADQAGLDPWHAATLSLSRWRTRLAEASRLSPHTINRMLAAVKRLVRDSICSLDQGQHLGIAGLGFDARRPGHMVYTNWILSPASLPKGRRGERIGLR